MKRAGVVAAGLALAASTAIATPSFAAKHQDPCVVLQNQVDQLKLRLAHQGVDTRRGSHTLAKIESVEQTAKALHCKLTK